MIRRKFIVILFLSFIILQNAHGQYEKVNSHGLDIYYRIFGEGSPILIIGGGPGDVSDRYLSLSEGCLDIFMIEKKIINS